MNESRRDVFTQLLDLEDDFDLFGQTIDGVYFWERIRKKVSRKIYYVNKTGTEKSSGQRLSKREEYFRAARNVSKNLAIRNPYFASNADVLVFGNERRKKLDDGLWWDIIADPLLEQMDRSWVMFEKPRLHEHKTPAKTENLRYLDLVNYSPKVLQELNLARYELESSDKLLLNKLEREINSRFGVKIDLVSLVTNILYKRKIRYPQYKKILTNVDPKVVVFSKSGRYTFVEVCKDLGIPTIKLQTALRTEFNSKYSYPGDPRKHRTFADYKFVWGEESKERVPYPVADGNIQVVGYPFLEMQKERYCNEPNKNIILFISQTACGQELSDFAIKLSNKVDSETYEIVYKLHPAESDYWTEQYPKLKSSKVEVISEGETPLYKLLAQSSMLVGCTSSVLYEGLNFDLEVYLVDLLDLHRFDDLINNGYAEMVSTPDDLLHKIQTPTQNIKPDTERYFAKNPIENCVKSIDEIIMES